MKYLSVGIFCIFLFLKLAEMGKVNLWSWWWVCSPLWIYFILWLIDEIGAAIFRSAIKLEKEKREALKPKSGWQKKLEQMQNENKAA
jgi:small Trp-rich protein